MADPTTPIDETGVLAPVSLYAEQKVDDRAAPARRWTRRRSRSPACASPRSTASRRGCASTSPSTSSRATCGPTASWRSSASSSGARTCTSATPRAASAPCSRRPREQVAGEVFNIGDTRENYRKLDLVEEIRKQTDKGNVSFVQRTEDPRDYKVAFEKVHATLGYEITKTVPDGHRRVAAGARRRPLPGRVRAAATATSRDARAGDRRRRVHRQPPRRRAARPRRRGRAWSTTSAAATRTTSRARSSTGVDDPQGRGHGRRGDARGLPGGPAGGRLPPGRADRRAPLRRRSLDRRAREHRRHRGRAGGGAGGGRAARGARQHRGRVRRPGRAADARARADRPAQPVRGEQGRGRDLHAALHAPARPVDARAADGQRLRPAPGPARGGGRRGDLHRRRAGGPHGDDLRRRRADARLRARVRRRAGVRRGRPSPVTGVLNVSTGHETSVAGLASLLGLETELQPGPRGRDPALVPGPDGRRAGARAGGRRCRSADGLETIR